METLPTEVIKLIRKFQTDGIHPTAHLIKHLRFRNVVNVNGLESTLVIASGPDSFLRRGLYHNMYASTIREYYHSDFDEKFGIHLRWKNMLEQDAIES